MKQVSIAKRFLLIALCAPVVALAVSFDCAKAKSNVEKLICSDRELSKLDDALEEAYRAMSVRSGDIGQLMRDQRGWLAQRNTCQDRECVKVSYETRLEDLLATDQPTTPDKARAPWVFRLTQGSNLSVCRAYLERLNSGKQANYPFCDRPETGEKYGFTLLTRKPLSGNQVHELAQRAHGFMDSKNQDQTDLVNAQRQRLKIDPVDWFDPQTAATYLGKDIQVWQYDPPVDIDNDGQSDRIVVWRGYPVGNHLPGCGWEDKFSQILDDAQMPFFVDPALTRIDGAKTIRIFGHPSGGYKIYEGTKKETFTNSFRPIGRMIGIFKYQDTYYFDTFFDTWGDFNGARRTYNRINSVLGVFVHRNGETKQVCEYLWVNNPNDRPASPGR